MLFKRRLSTTSLIELSRALRYALSSGMMLRDAMDLLAREGTAQIRPVAARLAVDLKAGWSLHEGLLKQERSFPRLFVALAAVGEESGNLPEVMGELERYYIRNQKLRQEFISGISWPIVQFAAAILVIAGLILILGLIPVQSGNKSVDPLGLGLLGVQGAVWFLAWVFLALAALTLAYLVTSEIVRRVPFLQRMLFRVPVFGPCVRALAMTRLCVALKLMLDTRLSVLKAIQLAFTATDNSAFVAAAPTAVASIRRGNSIADSFGQTGVFPPPFRSALAVAEESGKLPEMCAVQAENYDDQSRRLLGTINKIASVIIWLVVAAFIITAIFRIFTNVYLKNLERMDKIQEIRSNDPNRPVNLPQPGP